MSNNYIKVFKEVLSNRNVLTIALSTSLLTLTGMSYYPYWSLYLKHNLGADMIAIGLLSTISSSERLLFQLPGGILADRYGRRKIIVYGTALRIIPPIIYLFATHWTHTIPALLFSGAASIYMPAFNAIIAESLPSSMRGAGYGAYRTITSFPMVIAPIIGGVVMDTYGYEVGIKLFMVLSIGVNIIVTYMRHRLLKETLDVDQTGTQTRKKPSIREQISGLFNMPRSVRVMVLVAFISSFGMQIVMGYLSVYAIDILGFTNTDIGLVGTTGGLISMILAMPGGMLSDKFGRKPMILISRIVSPLSYLGVTLVTKFQEYYAIMFVNSVGNSLGGGGMYAGGPAWNALLAELVPKEKLATVMGAIGTLTGLVALPAPVVGGWVWDEVDPKMNFYLSSAMGLLGAGVFLLGVQEPKKQEN